MSHVSHHSRLAASLSVIAGLTVAAPALAQKVTVDSSGEIMSTTIAYSPADLSTKASAQQMWTRIERASDIVCGGQPDVRLLDQRVAFDACRQQSRARAVNKLNAPLVAALAAQSGTLVYATR